MTTIEAFRRRPRATRASRASLGPPGVLFWLAVALAIVLGLDTNSRASFGELLWVAPIWLALAAFWLFRFGWWLWAHRAQERLRSFAAWLLVPAAMALVFVMTRFDVPFHLRLALSRGAMDQAAAEVLGGGATDRAWIGLYPVSNVERLPNGMRFVITDDLLGRLGFAYASDGAPADPGEGTSDDSGLWCCDQYESIGGGWYLWTQEWD